MMRPVAAGPGDSSREASNQGIAAGTPPRDPRVENAYFDDVDALATAVPSAEQSYIQLTRGPFRAQIESVTTSKLHVVRERINQSTRQRVRSQGLLVADSGPSDDRARWFGRPYASNTFVMTSPDEDILFRSPRDADLAYALIDVEFIRQTAAQCYRRELPDFAGGWMASAASDGPCASIARYLRTVLATATADPGAFAALAAQRQVEAGLLDCLFDAVEHAEAPARWACPSLRRRRAIVRRIEAHVDAYPEQSLTTHELCRIAHASRRTVEYAFRYCYDISPAAYVKAVRLSGVRTALQRAPELSVRDAAGRFGFVHMGHFGQDYRRQFHEPPSATLRRARLQRRTG